MTESDYGPHFYKVVYFSVILFILYMPQTSQNLASFIEADEGYGSLGYIIFGVLYVFQGIGALLSQAIINKIGLRKAMVISSLMFSTVILAQYFPTYGSFLVKNKDEYEETFGYNILTNKAFVSTVLIISSAVAGFGQAIIWVSLGDYITRCATESTIGFYFGLNYSIMMSSMLLGNFANAFLV